MKSPLASRFSRSRRPLAAAALLLALPAASRAVDGTWAVDANGNWSNTANWTGGVVADGIDGTANFALDLTAARTVTNDTPRTIGNINFDDTGAAGDVGWVLAGTNANPITLSTTTGPSTINTGGLLNFNNSFTISALLTGGANGVVYNAQNNSNGQRRQYVVNNPLNSYTGTTTIQNGFLSVGTNSILAAGSPLGITSSAIILGSAGTTANTAGGGTSANLGIDLTATAGVPNLTINRNIDSTTSADTAGRTLLGFNGPTGATGTLTVSGGWALGAGTVRGYGITISQPGQTVDFTGLITGTGTGQFRIGDFGTGLGTLRLSNVNNSFTNQITIEKGRLLIANDAAAGAVNGALGRAVTLNVGSAGVTAAGDVITAQTDGAFTVGKTINLNTNGGNVSTNVFTHVVGGNAAAASAFSGAVNTATVTTNRSLNVSQVAGGTTTFSGNIGPNGTAADAFVTNVDKVGAGTVAFNNLAGNTYDGTTRVLGGTLLINNTSASGTGVGSVNVGVVSPAFSGQTGNTQNTSTTAAANLRQINNISNAVAATLQLGQSVTGTGITAGSTVTGIALGTGAGTSSITISTTFSVPANTTTAFTDLAFAAATTATGTLGGSGILAPTGTNVVTVNNGSTLAPGNSPGILTITASTAGGTTQGTATLNMLTGSIFSAEINGGTPGTLYDQLVLNGTAPATLALSGNLTLTLGGGFTPAGGTSFRLVDNQTAGVLIGDFVNAPVGGTITSGGVTFNVTNGDGNDIVLTAAVPEPSTYALLGLGLVGLGLTVARRRQALANA